MHPNIPNLHEKEHDLINVKCPDNEFPSNYSLKNLTIHSTFAAFLLAF